MILFRDGEQLIGVYRRHKFTLFMELAPLAVFACIAFGAALFGIAELNERYAAAAPLLLLGGLLLVHVLWIAFFIVLADFYLDVWMLTSERLIAVEQQGLFFRTISEFELEKIQDVTTGVSGFFATILNYGDINVRTASEDQGFVFRQVWRPDRIKDEIMNACFAYEKRGQK